MPRLPRPAAAPRRFELVLILAALMSLQALTVDLMLPALPEIAAELTPGNLDRAQLVVGTCMFGAGIGMLPFRPRADS